MHTIIKNLMIENFDFPTNLMEYKTMRSSQDLSQTLAEHIFAQEFAFSQKFRYYVSMKNVTSLRAKCSKCSAFLSYKAQISPDNHLFRLVSYRISHSHHQIKKTTKRSTTVNFLRNHRQYESNIYQLRLMAKRQLGISNQTFYRAASQICGHLNLIRFPLFQTFLQAQGETRLEPFPIRSGFPDSLIFISPDMKQNYKKYGRAVFIDFTYNLVKDQCSQNHEWAAGFVTGLSNSCQIKVFAISLCAGETTKNVYMIMKGFFQIMGQQCQTVISDRGKGIIQAVKRLQRQDEFHGNHLFDAFHLMRSIKIQSSMKQYFNSLYKASDIIEYNQILSEAFESALNEEDRNCLKKFNSLSSLFCISKIPRTFVALGVSTSPAEKFNDIVKTTITRQENYCAVFLKLTKISSKVNRVKAKKIKRLPLDFKFVEGLQYLAQSLCLQAFSFLLKQIFKAVHHSMLDQYHLSHDSGLWTCECGLQQKTGLPCSHLLGKVICEGGNIQDYVSSFWIQDIDQKQDRQVQIEQKINKRGRPKKTRRNK